MNIDDYYSYKKYLNALLFEVGKSNMNNMHNI